MLRSVAVLGPGVAGQVWPRPLRRRLLTLALCLTRYAPPCYLHLATDWPWAHAFTSAPARLRALPLLA
jgi:hypothetical protein